MTAPACRFCEAPLRQTFVDLGVSPLSNAYLTAQALRRMEPFFPLHAYVCAECFLVQIEQYETPERIFGDYAYFSSYSTSWLAHAEAYTRAMIDRFGYGRQHRVIEIASNDGYLLQYFQTRGVPVLGIEPARNVAEVAQSRGISTMVAFFGSETATNLVRQGVRADLLVGNNVLAHVPALNDFVRGLTILLKEDGVATMEFPHLLRLVREVQFDTIYHEHLCYFSLLAVNRIFERHGLVVFDVDELPTHGGSLRIYARHGADVSKPVSPRVRDLLGVERAAGLDRLDTYGGFEDRVRSVKHDLLAFLIDARRRGKSIVGYGAPAKGNTLLNYCGVRTDFLAYTVDRSPHKQGRFLPGSRIPIHAPDRIDVTKPDYVLILPWNLKEEIMSQLAGIRRWGGSFVVPIPEVRIYR